MTSPARARAWCAAGLLAYLTGTAVLAAGWISRDASDVVLALLALPTVVLGLLIARQRPASPMGPALVGLAAAAVLTYATELWGASGSWPGAEAGRLIAPGVWVWQLTGFVLLCLVFPDGLLPGRRWAVLPWLFVAVAVLVNTAVSVQAAPGAAPGGPWPVIGLAGAITLLAVLGTCAAAPVIRYRRGNEVVRAQLRWLVLGAGSLPVLLAAGWTAQSLGAPVSIAYAGLLLALLVFLPGSVAIAVLRHDLLDVDRLLTETVSWILTTLLSAAAFAGLVAGVAWAGARQFGLSRATADSPVAFAAAAFVAALLLLPVHRQVQAVLGRFLDHERTVLRAGLHDFVSRVRDGRAEPEQVETELRKALRDNDLQLLLRLPGQDGFVTLDGRPAPAADPADVVPLVAAEAEVGVLVPGRRTARQLRRAREAVTLVRLPIEVSRLRMELRGALEDAQASRARLVEAVTDERRRLERDLHDGAQQGIIAVGMRLRSVQRRHEPGDPSHADLEAAVLALETIVGELRRMAHGLRPGRLDDGLEAAIRDLVTTSPIPVTVEVAGLGDVPESVATTAYFIVAECLTNTLKHARASAARVVIGPGAGQRLTVRVSDDGRGGATTGFGLTALQDRVGALGGRLAITSPAGAGTTIEAEI